MAASEALNACIAIVVRSHALHITSAGLRRPLRHGEGNTGCGKGLTFVGCADALIDPIHGRGLSIVGQRTKDEKRKESQGGFFIGSQSFSSEA